MIVGELWGQKYKNRANYQGYPLFLWG